MKYDVVIIGASVSGLMAARTLSKDSKFLVIDSKKEIGFPLKCGEGIRKDGFIELFGKTNYIFIKNKTNKFQVICDKVKRTINIDYLILDRPEFEKWLAAPIENNISLRTECLDIIKKQDFLEIITNKGKLQSNLVILAYGSNYKIQNKFGLIKENPILIPCYGGIYTNHKLDTKSLYFFFDDVTSSALWVFPKDKNKANVGIGVMPYFQKNDIRILLKQLIKKFDPSLKGKPSYAGVFPTTGEINKTYTDRLLVCGDAAGQVYAGAGEGIYFSLKAGKLAAETAKKAISRKNFKSSFLRKYEKAWKKAFGKQIKASLVFTSILFLGLKYKKLDKIFKAPKEKELIDIFMHGKIPLKSKLVCLVAKLFGLFDRKKKEPSRILRILWKFYKKLS